nr:hypothetical protein [Tanacetum cinerariifolium]
MALPVQNINHSAFRSMLEREKNFGLNFNDWFRSLKLVLRVKKKMFVIEQPIPLLMLPISPLKFLRTGMRQFENYSPYEMLHEIKSMFEKQAGVERFDLIQIFYAWKQEEEKLNYNMYNMRKTIGELHALLIEYEKGWPKKAATPQVMAIQSGGIQKSNKKSRNAKGKGKEKSKENDTSYIPKPKNLKPSTKKHPKKDDTCHHCKEHTPPHTSQHNGVFERRNHTLFDMVRSMMNLTTLPLYFWYYALESAIRIPNIVSTKKVNKTPYELWSGRTHRAPERLCLNVEVEDHSLGDLNEPANYKAALLDSESDKWLDAMNAKMQSMKDNQIWHLVDLSPNAKTVGSKWLFKKKTNMDGNIHTYNRLVAKGFTQTYRVDYKETFLPVADIRAIRILIAIAAFYDYEIWQIDCKVISWKVFRHERFGEAAFILSIKIYRDRTKRLIKLSQSAYMDKSRFKMDNFKRGNIPMQERLDLNKIQGASTPEELKREPHWTAVKTLKYLRNTKDMFLVYGGNPKAELRVDCYCDAGLETDRDDIKSQTGYVFILNGGAVDWKSSKKSTTAMSATKAEYIAASEAAMEAVWIRKFISGLGIVPTIREPIKMFCDNSATLLITNKSGVQRGARHYHRRYHYIRECIELGKINLLKVHIDDNLADPFTKALPKGKLTRHARRMGLRLASSFM